MTNNNYIRDLEDLIVGLASMLERDRSEEEKRAVIRLNRSEAATLAEVAVMILEARARAKDEQAKDEQGKTPFMNIRMGLN